MFACISLGAGLHAAAQTEATQTPTCSTLRGCEILWSDAQKALSVVSNMRIRLLTDTRIETFAPNGYGGVGGVVTKEPVGEAGYEIKLRLECYGGVGCEGINSSGIRLFNTRLASSPGNTSGRYPKVTEGSSTLPQASSQGVAAPKDSAAALLSLKSTNCGVSANPNLVAKGPGYEIYTAACANGDSAVVRCEFGSCRTLK